MMGIDQRYEERLTREIHEHLQRYGPTSARVLTESMNMRYKGNLTVHAVVGLLKKEESKQRIIQAEVLDKMILWASALEQRTRMG